MDLHLFMAVGFFLVVVLRVRAVCQDPKNRDEFLEKCASAYGLPEGENLPKGIRSQVLLAYHKDPVTIKNGFTSKNAEAAEKRGGPRQRRKRPGERAEAEAEEAAEGERQNAEATTPPSTPMYINGCQIDGYYGYTNDDVTISRTRTGSRTPGDCPERRNLRSKSAGRRESDGAEGVGPQALFAGMDEEAQPEGPRKPGKPASALSQAAGSDMQDAENTNMTSTNSVPQQLQQANMQLWQYQEEYYNYLAGFNTAWNQTHGNYYMPNMQMGVGWYYQYGQPQHGKQRGKPRSPRAPNGPRKKPGSVSHSCFQ